MKLIAMNSSLWLPWYSERSFKISLMLICVALTFVTFQVRLKSAMFTKLMLIALFHSAFVFLGTLMRLLNLMSNWPDSVNYWI